jgi:hypothetical protein
VETFLLIGSFYNFEEFMKECAALPDPISLRFFKDVLPDANRVFKIKSRNDLLSIIGNNEFQRISFYKTTEHDKNPSIKIDAFLFALDNKEGYLAIYKINNIWTLKSFHESNINVGDPSKSLQMKTVLKQLASQNLYFDRR